MHLVERPASAPRLKLKTDPSRRLYPALLLLVLMALAPACSSTKYVALRSTPHNPLAAQLQLFAKGGPKPTERTRQLLRRYALQDKLGDDRQQLLAELGEVVRREPSAETAYAMAELAYLGGKQKEMIDEAAALDLYTEAVLHASTYLFDPQYRPTRNPYDPQYRGAAQLYNAALEGALRIVRKRGELQPGGVYRIQTAQCEYDVSVEWQGAVWRERDFDQLEFVSDYAMVGLTNHHQRHGLGVPLIAICENRHDDPAASFYPPKLAFPVTAYLRLHPQSADSTKPARAVLEFYDPLRWQDIQVAGRRVPLEADLSTPLAFLLNQSALDDSMLSTLGLLKVDAAQQWAGFYMIEPYQPGKIPVVMVHGLWSSPITWMEMFNDLRADPLLRQHFQFWFYMYPTGQPFWNSAAQMRQDIAQMRRQLDPQRREAALDQMVLIGHSMGGLVSKLQTIDSGDSFWRVVSDRPFEKVKASDPVRQRLEEIFFFEPNPAVRRVVTLGTPHRGSDFANDLTRWLGRKLIRLPTSLVLGKQQLLRDNPDFFRASDVLQIDTSIDSLAPESPFLMAMLSAPKRPSVVYHNVIGQEPEQSLFQSGPSDGVVLVESAKLENAASQIIVPANHSGVHRHPRSILEVRRILYEHLDELRTIAASQSPVQPASVERVPPYGPAAPQVQTPTLRP